jgi:hypothetical protein
MNISVAYDETDVAKALEKIIKDPNSAEFVKLLTPMICQSSPATNHFFKLMLGNKLPDVIPKGTLCKINVNNLGYSANKQAIKDKYGDQNGCGIVSVKEFRGYHDYSNYTIDYTNISEADNSIKKDYTHVQGSELEIMDDI